MKHVKQKIKRQPLIQLYQYQMWMDWTIQIPDCQTEWNIASQYMLSVGDTVSLKDTIMLTVKGFFKAVNSNHKETRVGMLI